LVQQQFQLSNGGAVRLTVARYYTPLGRNIQKPYNKGKEQYEEELIERFHNGEVVIGDTSKPTGQAYKTPAGRIVYGGGGITPDIFVPFDTTAQPKVLTDLFLKGTLNNFAYHYFLNHKKTIASFRSPIDFYIQFNFTAADWTELSNYALRDSIYLNQLPAKAKDELLKKIPAFIARQQWQTEGYIQIANLSDAMITKALQVLQ
jgi:carboxyl-terminal processing protease